MSIEALNWALWQDRIADPVARHVLLVLANHAQEDGRNAFCSVETMCCATRLGERTIRRKLDELEAQGAIRKGNQAVAAAYIDRADRRPTVFDLAIEPIPTKREAVLRLREKKRGATVTPRPTRGVADNAAGCRSVHDGVPLTAERGATAAPEPSITHQLNHLVSGDARDACLKPERFECWRRPKIEPLLMVVPTEN